MPDLWMDVDAALSEVPVNIMPLIDDTDFKSREESVAYNAAGLELIWHFTTTAGATSATVVTPTTGGAYDWAHQDGGMYTIEIPASGGASINNDTEGFGWFTGVATGVLPWRGPVIGFRAAGLNNALIDDAYSATRGLAGTALPDAAADAAGGLPISDAGGLDLDAQVKTAVDAIKAKTDSLTFTGTDVKATLDSEKVTVAANEDKTGYSLSTAPPTAAAIADAVWDETLVGHAGAGSAGEALAAAGAAGDPWITPLPGAYGAGTAGKIVGDNLNATVSSRSSHDAAAVKTAIEAAGSHLALIKAKTDNLTFTVAGDVDCNVQSWKGSAAADMTGDAYARLGAPAGASVSADVAAVKSETAAIVADTNELQTDLTNGGRLDLILDGILEDTGTTIPALLGTPAGASLAADIAAIEAQTDDIGVAGAGLTAVPWNAAWDAEVQSECADALNAYDPPTKAELDAADDAILAVLGTPAGADMAADIAALPTATENADALLNRDMSAVSDTTARSPLNALRQLRNKVAIVAGTMTVYEEDDATEAWTAALTTDASAEAITVVDPA